MITIFGKRDGATMENKTYDSDMLIIDLPLSRKTKRFIQEMELCTIKDLDNENYFTLKGKFTNIYEIGTIIKEMNTLGFLIPAESENFYIMRTCLRDCFIFWQDIIFFIYQNL